MEANSEESSCNAGEDAHLSVPSNYPLSRLGEIQADSPPGPADESEQSGGPASDGTREAHTFSRPATAPLEELDSLERHTEASRNDAQASSRSAQHQRWRETLGSTPAAQAHKRWHAEHEPRQAVKNEPEPVERCVLALEVGDAVVAHGVRERFGHGRWEEHTGPDLTENCTKT